MIAERRAPVQGFSEYVERLCRAEGFVPEVTVRSSGVGTLVVLAASGHPGRL